jgi:hypothetical protein
VFATTVAATVPCGACGEALAADVHVCTACGAQASKPYFYPVSLFKFAFFATTSFGIYLVWWFWSQLRAEAPGERFESAAFKTVFSGVFFYSIARQAKDEAEANGVRCRYSPAVLTGLLWAGALASRVFDSGYGLVITLLLLPAPFVPVQQAINRVHAATDSDTPGPWLWWQVAIAVVLGLFWLLMILGLVLPAPPGGGKLA